VTRTFAWQVQMHLGLELHVVLKSGTLAILIGSWVFCSQFV